MEILERGLVQLSLADTAVEVTATPKGERILACLGELHLEQSILDLQKVYCAKEIELRISDPIVEFGETTDWFHDHHPETADFAAFFDDAWTQPPMRQMVIPPYNEEEGIDFAARGRSRAVVSGRLAAIGVRTVPLATSVYQSLQQKKRIEGSDEDLLETGRALGCQESTPEGVFQMLLETLCALDKSGNAILQSKGIADGSCVKGVVSSHGEIYLPPKGHDVTSNDSGASLHQSGYKEFQSARHNIRMGGLKGAGSSEMEMSPADQAAMTIWNNNIKGSVAAGFQVAMRSGPICEEQVRRVLVVLESVEIAVAHTETAEDESEATYSSAKPLNGGMVVAALRSGIRCALL
jgi:ribosome assembly protein 1